MTYSSRSPSEIRSMFGRNLRSLSQDYPSISELSRQLGINRTQFNRYLSGESFPRPDVLARICAFFGVDARILLEPVEVLTSRADALSSDFLADFIAPGARDVPESDFPNGFYRFSRRSFVSETQFVVGLVYVFRRDGVTYIRGFEAKEAMRQQGLPTNPQAREFRGLVLRQEDGITALISRRNTMTSSFNYLARVPSMENNFWAGYITRTVRDSGEASRAERMVYEHLGSRSKEVFDAARGVGLIPEDALLPYHKRLLRPDQPFT